MLCDTKAHLARLTPFSVSKLGVLLTKSLSETNSVSKTAILLTKSLSKTHSVSKTADLLTEFIECARSRCAELVGAGMTEGGVRAKRKKEVRNEKNVCVGTVRI